MSTRRSCAASIVKSLYSKARVRLDQSYIMLNGSLDDPSRGELSMRYIGRLQDRVDR